MPKKQSKKSTEQENKIMEEIKGGKIVNFYEHIPKQFLDKPDNPNFHLHKINLPFRACLIAPSGSGKTNFLINLLHLFSCGEKGTFQTITIITKNKDEPLYNWITSVCNQIVIKEGLNNTPPLDKFDKDYNHLVVWDDLVLSKDLSMVETFYIRARKFNVNVLFISQSYYRIPKMIRSNCSYMILLKLSGKREVNMILSEFGLGVSRDELLAIYNYATRDKMQPLLIDMEAMPNEKFRKGVLEIIDFSRLST